MKTRDPSSGDRSLIAFSQLLGRGMRPRVEDVVGNGAELLMNSVGNFRPAMADLTQPQAAHAVDVFVAFGVPEAHTFATDKFAKLLLVLGPAWHRGAAVLASCGTPSEIQDQE